MPENSDRPGRSNSSSPLPSSPPTPPRSPPMTFPSHLTSPAWEGVLTADRKRYMKKYRTEIAACTASLLSTFAAYPLDSVKTRMQAYKFVSFTDCVAHTYKTEGVHGFWRGVWSPLASITLVRTVSFSIYQKAKYSLDASIYRATGESPLAIANTQGAHPTMSTVTCFGLAGAAAGAFITVIACPFELTKLSAQISVLMAKRKLKTGVDNVKLRESYQQKGTIRTAQNIIKHRGIGGLYSGFGFHLLRDSIGTAIYFMTYESSKQLIANARGHQPTSPLAVVVAGGLCGIVSWACIYPIDSAKSIYQRNCLVSPRGSTEIPKIQFLNPRMYRGLGVSMTRSAAINAIFFSVFESMKKGINSLEIDENRARYAD